MHWIQVPEIAQLVAFRWQIKSSFTMKSKFDSMVFVSHFVNLSLSPWFFRLFPKCFVYCWFVCHILYVSFFLYCLSYLSVGWQFFDYISTAAIVYASKCVDSSIIDANLFMQLELILFMLFLSVYFLVCECWKAVLSYNMANITDKNKWACAWKHVILLGMCLFYCAQQLEQKVLRTELFKQKHELHSATIFSNYLSNLYWLPDIWAVSHEFNKRHTLNNEFLRKIQLKWLEQTTWAFPTCWFCIAMKQNSNELTYRFSRKKVM